MAEDLAINWSFLKKPFQQKKITRNELFKRGEEWKFSN